MVLFIPLKKSSYVCIKQRLLLMPLLWLVARLHHPEQEPWMRADRTSLVAVALAGVAVAVAAVEDNTDAAGSAGNTTNAEYDHILHERCPQLGQYLVHHNHKNQNQMYIARSSTHTC